jgi:hypothetical protein
MIGINEAIADCIYKLLKNSDETINNLIKVTDISKIEMEEYLSCNKNVPLTKLCAIAEFFGLGINEFLIKARILNHPDSDKINPQDVINFKASFMSLWDRQNLNSQNLN